MKENFNRFRFSVSPLTPPALILFWLFDRTPALPLTFAAALCHELGHIAVARLCGIRTESVTLLPLGAEIRLEEKLRSARCEFFIAMSGIFVNALLCGMCARFFSGCEYAMVFAASNGLLAVFNFLPVKGLDGGQAAEALFGEGLICSVLSGIGLCVMWLCALYMMFYGFPSFSLFLICCMLFYSEYVSKRKTKNK